MRLLSIILCCFFFTGYTYAQNEFSEAIGLQKDLLQKNPQDTKALKEISFLYLHQANYDEAIRYGEQLLYIGYQSGDYDYALLYAHIVLGQANMMKGNKKEATANLHQAKAIAESNQNDSALCSVYNGLGLYAANIEKDYYRSIDLFFQGIAAAERSGYSQLHTILLINISGIYYLKDDPVGLSYSLEAYERGHKESNPYHIFAASVNTAYMYYLCDDYEKALQYIKEAEFLTKQNDFYDQTNIYALYGHILLAQGNTDEAIVYFERGLDAKDKAQTSSIVYTLYGYARAWHEKQAMDRAIPALEEALELTYTENSPIYRDKLQKELSLCYESKGEYDRALEWQRRFQTESESLFNTDKERALSDLRMKYDTERRENEIKEVKLNLLQKTKNEQLFITSLIAFFLIVLSLIYFIWRRNRFFATIVHQYQAHIRREKQMQQKLRELETDNDPQTGVNPEESQKKYPLSSLTEEKSMSLFLQLERLMREEAVYRDNFLTKEKVADMLGTNRTYLSQIINQQTSLTFTQYVNEYRINEAVKLISDSENQIPLKTISSDVGFSSMTTFYKAFQNTVGMTPSQYKNKTTELYKNH
ncbi:AraC family transcriptional regulator [Proteiniphilum sp. UBA5384]|uniref:AraC family transcriptional regulator n=1 Tax=Proteiniphilum sp. UBA5384 TaxID=1947279 RepID=UPI0025DB99B8|nr:AraC family transcriptional regulator [Proteiniphilum sp. UBA5384]